MSHTEYQGKPKPGRPFGAKTQNLTENRRNDPDWSMPTERQKQAQLVKSLGADMDKANKSYFAERYRLQLLARFPWAQDKDKLQKFMDAVWKTLNGGNAVDRTGHAWKEALRECGLPSTATLTVLHALPHGE